jgi:hypothetical protein
VRRISWLLYAAALAALLIPVPAARAEVSKSEPRQKDVRQASAEVKAYWTAKRMRTCTR